MPAGGPRYRSGGGSGRVHNQIATTVMLPIENHFTQAIGSILYLALVGSVLAFSLYYWLLRYAPATRLSLLVYGIPLVAVSLGVALGEEKAGPNTFLGMAAILAGVFLVLTPRTRKSSG